VNIVKVHYIHVLKCHTETYFVSLIYVNKRKKIQRKETGMRCRGDLITHGLQIMYSAQFVFFLPIVRFSFFLRRGSEQAFSSKRAEFIPPRHQICWCPGMHLNSEMPPTCQENKVISKKLDMMGVALHLLVLSVGLL
jgi:hypothetical protein